jgi:hypothetical protein
MEMRVYAEDTGAGFVPAPGLVHALKLPSIDCRVESAIIEGKSHYYYIGLTPCRTFIEPHLIFVVSTSPALKYLSNGNQIR